MRNESGEILNLLPRDVIPNTEIFGQHEISELTKSKDKLTLLLSRFVESDGDSLRRKPEVRRELERSRAALAEIAREAHMIDDRLAALPGLEETLIRFREAGLEDKLKGQTLLVREEKLLKTAHERVSPLRAVHQSLRDAVLIDTAFLSPKALEGLPSADLLGELQSSLDELGINAAHLTNDLEQLITQFDATLTNVRARWTERKKSTDDAYQKILRELQKSKIDGAEFVELRRRIEELRPLKEKKGQLERDLRAAESQRRSCFLRLLRDSLRNVAAGRMPASRFIQPASIFLSVTCGACRCNLPRIPWAKAIDASNYIEVRRSARCRSSARVPVWHDPVV